MLPSRSSSHRAALASALLLALASTSSFASTMAGDDDDLHYDDADHATLTLDGANGTRIRNVAEGTEPTDAVNLNQMEVGDMMAVAAAKKYADVRDDLILAAANKHAAVGDTQTLVASNAYTDQKFAVWNDTFAHYQQQVDLRFDQTDARIDRSGAMQTAMAQMTASAAGVRTVNRMAVGVGAQNGKAALSLGYQRALGDKAALTIGAAFSGNERSAGVGYGFGW